MLFVIPRNQDITTAALHLQRHIACAENRWANIDVIYYEYGALVLVYNNGERATRSFNILQDAVFDSKPLLVLLLPNIQVAEHCID